MIRVVVILSAPLLQATGIAPGAAAESIREILGANPGREVRVVAVDLDLASHGVYVEGAYGAIHGEGDQAVIRARALVDLALARIALEGHGAYTDQRGQDLLNQLVKAAFNAAR